MSATTSRRSRLGDLAHHVEALAPLCGGAARVVRLEQQHVVLRGPAAQPRSPDRRALAHAVLRQEPPPRSDSLSYIEWDSSGMAGREAYIELVDRPVASEAAGEE